MTSPATPAAPAGPSCDHRHVGELERDGCAGFVHHDLGRMHAFVDHDAIGDLAGHGLDQLTGWTGDDVGGALRENPVVEGVGQIVAGRRHIQVEPGGDVDDELLAVSTLMVEDAVMAANPQATQLDPIGQRPCSPACCHAPTTASASTEARTSCTRTPHTWCQPASAETTAVAVSLPSGGRG